MPRSADVAVRRVADAQRVPRLVKLAVLAALAGVVVALAAPSLAAPAGRPVRAALPMSLEAGVLEQLNQIRVQYGLAPLKPNAALTASAAQHSREMGTVGYFQHESADGTLFWKRITHWYGSTGYSYWTVGENLLWSSPDVDPASALRLWMASPEHRKNILNPAWREIGVSALHFAAAPGTYGGRPVTIITTDFGERH